MKTFVIFSVNDTHCQSGLKIEGYGFTSKKETENRIKDLYKHQVQLLKINREFQVNQSPAKKFFMQEVNLPEQTI